MGNSLNLSLPPKQEMTFSYNIPKEDRISSLPDDVILLILPFLPLKEMVKTSILSKRWQNLWVHTPLLDFHGPISYDIDDFDGPISFGRQIDDTERLIFAEWVDRVLRRHDGRYLKEFKIVCWLNGHMQNRIDNWLEFALSRKVQHLKVDLSDSGLYPINMGYNYVFPDRFLEFDLKCLKSLSFTMVEVTGEAFNCFLLNCPFLERLEVVGSAEFAGLDISHPNLALKYLKIKWCRNLEVLRVSNFNLVSLDISSVGDLTLTDLPLLVKLSISEYGWTPSHSLSQAPSCYSQLESLTLLGLELKEEVSQLSYLGQMTKLKRLVIKVSASGDESLTILASIIISCPCLEEFVSMVLWSGSELTRRTISEVERGSSSLKSKSLKVFEFMGYRDCVSDVELIMHVVENAICLEKIIIDPRRPIYLTSHHYSESAGEQEARRLAKKQLKALRKSESIPPHVEVVIR